MLIYIIHLSITIKTEKNRLNYSLHFIQQNIYIYITKILSAYLSQYRRRIYMKKKVNIKK